MNHPVKLSLLLVALGVGVSLISSLHRPSANALPVSMNRWLAVRQTSGSVLYQPNKKAALPAKTGMRLQAVGDRLKTGDRSSATLEIDIGIGFVHVAEKTNLVVQKIEKSKSGGHITQLQVSSGQARLRLRSFTNSTSRLEVQTPAGVSGVRGTEFGITVHPNGTTGVATFKGGVATSAQGQSVLVKAGLQSLITPGEPPSPPTQLNDIPRLDIRQLTKASNQQVRIVGQIDPTHLVTIANLPQNIDRQGRFDITVPLTGRQRVTALVTTPLGKQQTYELTLP